MTRPPRIEPSLADQVAAVIKEMPDPSGGAATGHLEQGLARMFGVPHAVAVASGTAALHAALSACGIGPGDEVLIPALTVIMTVALRCPKLSGQGSNRILIGKGTGSSAKREDLHS